MGMRHCEAQVFHQARAAARWADCGEQVFRDVAPCAAESNLLIVCVDLAFQVLSVFAGFVCVCPIGRFFFFPRAFFAGALFQAEIRPEAVLDGGWHSGSGYPHQGGPLRLGIGAALRSGAWPRLHPALSARGLRPALAAAAECLGGPRVDGRLER